MQQAYLQKDTHGQSRSGEHMLLPFTDACRLTDIDYMYVSLSFGGMLVGTQILEEALIYSAVREDLTMHGLPHSRDGKFQLTAPTNYSMRRGFALVLPHEFATSDTFDYGLSSLRHVVN